MLEPAEIADLTSLARGLGHGGRRGPGGKHLVPQRRRGHERVPPRTVEPGATRHIGPFATDPPTHRPTDPARQDVSNQLRGLLR
jgi:hypothetical protein